MRPNPSIFATLLLLGLPSFGMSQALPPPDQIAAALQAAPEAERDGATVLGYDRSGELRTLRAGSGPLVCLADDPTDGRFSVACYHASLEPYMERGRELRKQGVVDGTARNEIRWREAEEGRLEMPRDPATLYVLTGSGFDQETGQVLDPYLRFVIYTPWATIQETGLPDRPIGPGTPWLMFPGTAGAHIMISPPEVPGGS